MKIIGLSMFLAGAIGIGVVGWLASRSAEQMRRENEVKAASETSLATQDRRMTEVIEQEYATIERAMALIETANKRINELEASMRKGTSVEDSPAVQADTKLPYSQQSNKEISNE